MNAHNDKTLQSYYQDTRPLGQVLADIARKLKLARLEDRFRIAKEAIIRDALYGLTYTQVAVSQEDYTDFKEWALANQLILEINNGSLTTPARNSYTLVRIYFSS